MIEIEIDKQDPFREQSVPIISQIEGQEIETANKSVVFPCGPPTVLATSSAVPKPRSTNLPMLPIRLIILMNFYRKPKKGSDPNGYLKHHRQASGIRKKIPSACPMVLSVGPWVPGPWVPGTCRSTITLLETKLGLKTENQV